MNPSPCDLVRLALLEGPAFDGAAITESAAPSLSAEQRAHFESCVACQNAARTWPLAARALSELRRERAPRELDSAVVGALHAGARTERAVRALQRLARLSPPPQLGAALDASAEAEAHERPADLEQAPTEDGLTEEALAEEAKRLRAEGRTPAPRVLDRLVQEELLDPAKARVRRHVGGLHRLPAPDALFERVAGELTRERREREPRAALRSFTARRLRLVLGAAAVFALLALPFLSRTEDLRDDSRPRSRPFRVERASSLGALSPITRDLLNTASSGMSSPDRS
jgi:hypothetical protein